MSSDPTPDRIDTTRDRVLDAAFHEFFRFGFQGGSLNRVVEASGATKGALFHYFSGKQALGYAVMDERIAPLMRRRWLEPLTDAADPITAIQSAFRRYVENDIASGNWLQGCPLNNLAQEMSPLDEGFRTRIDTLYCEWRSAFAAALEAGITAGRVRRDIDADLAATFLVAAQMGIWGTGKYSRDAALMRRASDAACAHLETLRP